MIRFLKESSWPKYMGRTIVFIICILLTIYGKNQVGKASGLGIMLLGLAGFILLLYFYNKPYK